MTIKKIIAPSLRALGMLSTVVLTAQGLSAVEVCGPEAVRPNYTPVVAGLDYAHLQTTNWNNGEPWSIHIARLDRSQKDLEMASVLADGRVFGTAPISTIAKSFPRERGEPLVVINAGFCIRTKHPYLGAPRGMVITDGELISAPGICPWDHTFWVGKDREMHFGKFKPGFNATLPAGTTASIGLNYECPSNGVVLYTHMLGKNTRATNNLELVLENPSLKQLSWHVGESYTMRVKAVNPSGNTMLSNSIAVLSFGSQMRSTAGRNTGG